MPICPVCKYEYDSGETECVDCGVALIDELPENPENDIEGVQYVPFRSYPSRLDAEIIREALANEGIPAIIKTDEAIAYTEISGPPLANVVLWVAEDSHEIAEQIADQMRNQI